ncbi:DoxX family protein [Roseospira goensis]|uniref:Putative oxidoreductase n=1 Tax=Roseospira goensis TaxID=391922 RepID=A0A7W6S1G9_9PROT|nr:DoxX family protein [Roseospira goensis]MBB4287150.1 putative oxidoreductase [Roseospira goensis]
MTSPQPPAPASPAGSADGRAVPSHPLAAVWCATTRGADRVPAWTIGLLARLGLAGVFWRSGQTKVSGWEITDTTYFLFQDEYAVPLLPPDLAAQLATTAEHVFPVLLVLGLFTRLSALGLLVMTAVIQVFVYPGNWPEHALWATALLLLILRGPGPLSLDHLLGRWWRARRR